MRLLRLILLAAFVTLPVALRAQVGASTDIVTGRVIGPDSQPVVGAKVDVTSAETQITRSTRTNDHGRYTVVFPDGGGQYRVTITYIGFAPVRLNVQRNADEDRLVADARLSQNPTTLSEVTVRGRQQPQLGQRAEAGGTERGLPPMITNRLPVDAGDLTSLATLIPGVVTVPGTDSTPMSFSVAGQPASQNSITLDGLTFGAGAIPADAVRNTRVITNTYDVARGQFTGGQVATTTRGGTNNFTGTATYQLRDPSLEFSTVKGPFGNEFAQNQLSFGVGGPVVKDRAFLFGSGLISRRSSGLPSLITADPGSLARLGANVDSVSRFLGVLGSKGLPAVAASDRVNDNASALLRGDYTINEMHSLTMRLDWRGSSQDNARLGVLAVPQSGGSQSGSGGGAMLTLTSRLGSFVNEGRVYSSVDKRQTDPYLALPAGRVIVASVLEDGTNAISTLSFGGNSSLPQRTRATTTEASDELSWISPEAAHRVKLGGLLTVDRNRQGSFANQFGTFTFNSLADFANDRPASFTRTLSSRDRESGATSGALYLGDGWRVNDALQVTLGARAEGSRYPTKPAYNPAIESAFGRRTDDVPSEVSVSPRAGFTWQLDRQENAPPSTILRGGFGEFRSRPPSQLVASALDATGLGTGQTQLVCVGSGVPTPDWAAYQSDLSTIPADCAGGVTTGGRGRSVLVFDPDFQAPRAWRGSLGLTRRFQQRYGLSVDATYARGVAQTGATDLNLNESPRFTLAAEGSRPVYVRPDSIVPATGQTSVLYSRRDAAFGTVNELSSKLRSDTKQVTVSLTGFGLRGTTFNTGYTWSRSRAESFGFGESGFGGNTAGDPNVAEWGRSDLDRRHQLFAQILYPVTPSLDASFVARASSGSPYSPMVAGDVNGDGTRNDRAFVFDPATPAIAADTALVNGMSRLLATAPGNARECLRGQLSSIAGRNSCIAPWTGSLDMQLNWRPTSFNLNRRLTLSVQMLNVLTGVDQLLHGNDDLKGWGQQSFPDRTLLYVRGFDPSQQRYVYQVNEHFGAANNRGGFVSPFQIGILGRWQIGLDDTRRGIFNVVGGRGGQPLPADSLRDRMRRGFANPFYRILEVKDSVSLALSADQETKLKTLGDSLQAKVDPIIDALSDAIAKQGKNADFMSMQVTLGPKLAAARTLMGQALKDAQATLTADQWAKLPESMKRGAMRGVRGGGPGEGGGRPRGEREP
ncbi:MAG: TonB-dependent receptor [Gemmatimonadaceae bacterium]|nr:TonB-dependent receptor [Gemmatimonadaceae bacterium]NUR19794.1 TonB-dependent receptor [Gemmatimonadaceae bacterium]